MADLVITVADVLAGDELTTMMVTAGDTIQAGMPAYKDTTDGNLYKPCDTSDAAPAVAAGIAMHNAERGQPLVLAVEGDLALGDVLAVGEIYVVGAVSGAICPAADLLEGDYVTVLGIATATDTLDLKIHVSGVPLSGVSPSPSPSP